MPKQQITKAELEQHLDEQLSFLKASADAFDGGAEGEAKRLALTIRVLLHETNTSHSLLGQLSLLSGKFVSTATEVIPDNILTHGGLLAIKMETPGKTCCFAPLDLDDCVQQMLDFKDWWKQVVFIDGDRRELTRERLVLTAADQDGGAHVDPALDETYANLKRNNSLNWFTVKSGIEKPMDGAERAAIRQVAHEVLKTLRPGYSKTPQIGEGAVIRDVAIICGNR